MTKFHFSNHLMKKFKKSGARKGNASPKRVRSNSGEDDAMEEVMSNVILKNFDEDKKSCYSSSSESSFDVASDISQNSVERVFKAVDGYVSVTGVTRYANSETTDPEVSEELEQEVNNLQNLLDEDEKTGTPTDAKALDLEAEIPWEKNHKRVLTMTVETHKHHGHGHRRKSQDPVPVNNEIPEGMATNLPNRKIPLHKEFACTKLACTNLACTNPHCDDAHCGAEHPHIEVPKSDPDLYSSRYALDTAVVHADRTVKRESEINSHQNDHYYGKPIMFVMDSRNKFHPLTRQKDAHKLADICKDYRPTKAQEYVVNTLMQSEDANMAAHDIWTGKFIRNCQEENLMTDVNITIGDELFTAHRIMLAHYSTYFQELFCISERDCPLPFSIRIRGISADVFEVFLHLIYMGDCDITPSTVKDLSMVAKRFGVEKLRLKINEYFLTMSSDDCLEILQGGCVSLDDPMYESALKSVIRDFNKVARNPNFLKLRLDTVTQILSSDVLDVENETEVFNAAKAWIQHDLRQREQHLSRVMQCVRFALMKNYELFLILSDNDLLQKNAYCREMLMKANWLVMSRMLNVVDPFDLPCPKKRESASTYLNRTQEYGILKGTTKETKNPKGLILTPGDLLAFGGFFSGSDQSRCIEGAKSIMWYNVATRNWNKIADLPEPRVHHAACVLNGKIYISGGSNPSVQRQCPRALAQCFCFDPYTMKWTKIAPMKNTRLLHSMVALDGRLYVMGGQDSNERLLNRVECYDPEADKWFSVASIQVPRIGSSACVVDGKIYLAGGYTASFKVKSGTPISSVLERYDPNTNKWSRLGDIRLPRCHAALVEVRGDLYLCGGATRTHGTDFTTAASIRDIDKYNKKSDIWEKVADLDTERHACGGAAVGNKIYICGGACAALGHMMYSMEVYDAVTGQSNRSVPDCPFPGKFLSLIPVPPR